MCFDIIKFGSMVQLVLHSLLLVNFFSHFFFFKKLGINGNETSHNLFPNPHPTPGFILVISNYESHCGSSQSSEFGNFGNPSHDLRSVMEVFMAVFLLLLLTASLSHPRFLLPMQRHRYANCMPHIYFLGISKHFFHVAYVLYTVLYITSQ